MIFILFAYLVRWNIQAYSIWFLSNIDSVKENSASWMSNLNLLLVSVTEK